MCNQRHKLNKTAHLFDHYLVLIIHKINTVRNIYAFVKYLVSVLGTRQKRPQILGTRQNFVLGSSLLAGKLQSPISHYSRYLPSPKLTSTGIIPTTPVEILDIGRTCKGTRSKGVDDIPNT